MNSNTFIDVHTFDGKLRDTFKQTIQYTIQQKENLFRELIKRLSNHNAIELVNVMIRDMYVENGGDNYQIENNLDATDILVDILNKDYKDLLPIIEEQLADSRKLGVCPSGRVTRLLQIWQTLI